MFQVPLEIAENQVHQDVRVRGVRWVLAVNVERQGRGVREGRTAVTVDQETVAAAEDHQEPPAQQVNLFSSMHPVFTSLQWTFNRNVTYTNTWA